MLGWLAAGKLGGALDWRPLIWVTGGSNTGKSTLLSSLTNAHAKTSNIKLLEAKKITKKFCKSLKSKNLVIVKATSQQMLRCGFVVVAGNKFTTDIVYAELLKKTYNFIIL